MIRRLILLAVALMLTCVSAVAAPNDIKCSGVLVAEDGEPIIGATISVPGTKIVATTDVDGRFTLTVPKGKEIHVNYIGYKPLNLIASSNLGEIRMEVESQMLSDVVVTQSIARTRRTPVAVSAVDAATLDIKLGNQELPEVLKTTPGVWATKDGGGFGDAKINIRGFKSSNTATMVNGVPINDMEWGGIYWSNWSGLGDVISSMQVQRGLGATIISSPSFGGTINMVTKGLDSKKGGTAWYGLGNDNSMNYGISFSTGLMKNGWAMTFLGSRKTGDGYVQGTDYEQFNYFFNISKRLNDKNQISLTVTGAHPRPTTSAVLRTVFRFRDGRMWPTLCPRVRLTAIIRPTVSDSTASVRHRNTMSTTSLSRCSTTYGRLTTSRHSHLLSMPLSVQATVQVVRLPPAVCVTIGMAQATVILTGIHTKTTV